MFFSNSTFKVLFWKIVCSTRAAKLTFIDHKFDKDFRFWSSCFMLARQQGVWYHLQKLLWKLKNFLLRNRYLLFQIIYKYYINWKMVLWCLKPKSAFFTLVSHFLRFGGKCILILKRRTGAAFRRPHFLHTTVF